MMSTPQRPASKDQKFFTATDEEKQQRKIAELNQKKDEETIKRHIQFIRAEEEYPSISITSMGLSSMEDLIARMSADVYKDRLNSMGPGKFPRDVYLAIGDKLQDHYEKIHYILDKLTYVIVPLIQNGYYKMKFEALQEMDHSPEKLSQFKKFLEETKENFILYEKQYASAHSLYTVPTDLRDNIDYST